MALPASLKVSAAREDHSLSLLAYVSSTRDSTHELTHTSDVSPPASLPIVVAREENSFSPLTHVPSTRDSSVESDSTPQITIFAACRDSPSHDGSSINPSRVGQISSSSGLLVVITTATALPGLAISVKDHVIQPDFCKSTRLPAMKPAATQVQHHHVIQPEITSPIISVQEHMIQPDFCRPTRLPAVKLAATRVQHHHVIQPEITGPDIPVQHHVIPQAFTGPASSSITSSTTLPPSALFPPTSEKCDNCNSWYDD